MNEELQSTNEELQTMNEELQASSERLDGSTPSSRHRHRAARGVLVSTATHVRCGTTGRGPVGAAARGGAGEPR